MRTIFQAEEERNVARDQLEKLGSELLDKLSTAHNKAKICLAQGLQQTR